MYFGLTSTYDLVVVTEIVAGGVTEFKKFLMV